MISRCDRWPICKEPDLENLKQRSNRLVAEMQELAAKLNRTIEEARTIQAHRDRLITELRRFAPADGARRAVPGHP